MIMRREMKKDDLLVKLEIIKGIKRTIVVKEAIKMFEEE